MVGLVCLTVDGELQDDFSHLTVSLSATGQFTAQPLSTLDNLQPREGLHTVIRLLDNLICVDAVTKPKNPIS